MDFMLLDWVLALMMLVIAGGLLYHKMVLAPYQRLVRCPEKSANTYLKVRPVPAGKGTPSGVVICHCGLWGEENRDCDRRCLARV